MSLRVKIEGWVFFWISCFGLFQIRNIPQLSWDLNYQLTFQNQLSCLAPLGVWIRTVVWWVTQTHDGDEVPPPFLFLTAHQIPTLDSSFVGGFGFHIDTEGLRFAAHSMRLGKRQITGHSPPWTSRIFILFISQFLVLILVVADVRESGR